MKNLQTLDYSNQKNWKEFGNEYLKPLNNYASEVIEIKKELEQRINEGDKLGEVLKSVPELKHYLLGGISKEGEYKENSLAKLFRKSFGVHVKPKQWVSFKKNKDIESSSYTETLLKDTPFLDLAKELESKTEQALNCLGLKPGNSESSLPDYLKNEANLEKSIKSIYKQCLSVHPLHNSFSFFVSSFQNTPKRYLKRVYFLAEDIDKTAEILGAEPLLDIDDDEWVPYTYREDNLGSALSNMVSVVENGFTKIIAYGPNPFELLFKNVEDPDKGFREYADEKLNETDWSFPDYVSKFDSNRLCLSFVKWLSNKDRAEEILSPINAIYDFRQEKGHRKVDRGGWNRAVEAIGFSEGSEEYQKIYRTTMKSATSSLRKIKDLIEEDS